MMRVKKKAEQTDTATSTVTTTVSALSEEETKDGWVSLFDGQTKKGWHKYGGAPAGSAMES